MNVLEKMGWACGRTVGKVSRERREERPRLSATYQAELFATLASTVAARGIAVESRIKRDASGAMRPIAFQAVTAAGSHRYEPPGRGTPAARVTWHQLAHAMVRMTAHSFSADGQVHAYDGGTARLSSHRFAWTNIHRLLGDAHSLPEDLQKGMRKAETTAAWTDAMRTLLTRAPWEWRCVDTETESGVRRPDFSQYVGRLWLNLQLAMNKAELSVAFCQFFCTRIMEAAAEENCGTMSFVPTLSANPSSLVPGQAQHFTGKVRYRPQGCDPDTRYHGRASQSQRERGLLTRPLEAARGILPPHPQRRRAE